MASSSENLSFAFPGRRRRRRTAPCPEGTVLASAPLHTQDTEIGLGALV